MKEYNLASERGFLTIDFLFAIMATLGCMMLLLRVTMALVSVQISQYIVYAAARAHSAADISEADQKDAGEEKYASLLKDAGLMVGFLIPGQTIQKDGVIGEFNSIYSPPSGEDGTAELGIPFVGARSEIKLPRLGISVPIFGKTADSDLEFKTYVNAMLFREPSQTECREFYKVQRYDAILKLDNRFSKASSYIKDYVPMEDSGC